MYTYSFKGKQYEITKKNLLQIISRESKSILFWAEEYYRGLYSGFPDITSDLLLPDKGQYQFMNEIERGIEDDELIKKVIKIKDKFKEMVVINDQISNWVSNFVGLPPPQNKKDRQKVKNEVNKLFMPGSPFHNHGLYWPVETEYQELVKQSRNVLDSIIETDLQIQNRILELLAEIKKKEM